MKKSHLSVITILAVLLCCFITANAQTAPPQTGEDKVYKQSDVDKKAEMTERPRAQVGGKCPRGSSGAVKFEIILRRSGTVDISNMTQSSSCEAFDKSAYNAAKGIKFNPAIKDGQPVSVATWVEYRYSVY